MSAPPTRYIEDADGSLLAVSTHATSPIAGQKPGTSGLRKKTRVFQAAPYLANFVQALFDSLPRADVLGRTLVVSGDGRFWTRDATRIIVRMAAAAGYARVWVGRRALLSTPAVSAVIRTREGGVAAGGVILTASHNPGGPDEDFGIKYNAANGGPAPEALTDAVYAATLKLAAYASCDALPDVDFDVVGATVFRAAPGAPRGDFAVEVIDPVEDYAAVLRGQFDFPALRAFLARPGVTLAYDGMAGVAGEYATALLGRELGVPAGQLHNCEPLPDFGGRHPDPNLTYAPELVARMGLRRDGTPLPAGGGGGGEPVPLFGAAQDGDADRNMILGRRFFVTPSDSVALIAAHAAAIPAFARAGGLKGVARSMPTSAALDRVAAAAGIPLFEVPTGWKFFGNLMDSAALGGRAYNPFLCGEESFGTGSDHVREKDGLWAVLAWLSILAAANKDAGEELVGVEALVRAHWARYGRNYYARYDYEGVDAGRADGLVAALRARAAAFTAAAAAAAGAGGGGGAPYTEPLPGSPYALAAADEFKYVDPVDGSVSDKQGLRFVMADGSRVVYRLSGTGSVGATVRVYIEAYEADAARHDLPVADALAALSRVATAGLASIEEHTGRKEPTVIT